MAKGTSSAWLTRLGLASALAVMATASCVDERVVGVSAALLLQGEPNPSLQPGSKVTLVFQAVDDDGLGVPDQKVELVLTDIARLEFAADAGTNRQVLRTGRKSLSDGVMLDGALQVELIVPQHASPGSASLVASLEGPKGDQLKTRWVTFDIGDGGGGGAGGGGGGGGMEPVGGTGGAGAGEGQGGSAGRPGGGQNMGGAGDSAGAPGAAAAAGMTQGGASADTQ